MTLNVGWRGAAGSIKWGLPFRKYAAKSKVIEWFQSKKKKPVPGDNCTSLVLLALLVDVHSFCTWATTLNNNGLACTISVRRLTLWFWQKSTESSHRPNALESSNNSGKIWVILRQNSGVFINQYN